MKTRAQETPGNAPSDVRDAVGMLERLIRRLVDTKVVSHMKFQVRCGSCHKWNVAFAVKHVRARRFRQPIDQNRIQMRRQHKAGQQLLDRFADNVACKLAMDRLPPLPKNIGVGQRTVTNVGAKCMTLDQRIQVVMRFTQIQLARQHHGANQLRFE